MNSTTRPTPNPPPVVENDYQLCMETAKWCEAVLKDRYQAEGDGLGQYLHSVRGQLPPPIYAALWNIQKERNPLAHEHGVDKLNNRSQFLRNRELVFRHFGATTSQPVFQAHPEQSPWTSAPEGHVGTPREQPVGAVEHASSGSAWSLIGVALFLVLLVLSGSFGLPGVFDRDLQGVLSSRKETAVASSRPPDPSHTPEPILESREPDAAGNGSSGRSRAIDREHTSPRGAGTSGPDRIARRSKPNSAGADSVPVADAKASGLSIVDRRKRYEEDHLPGIDDELDTRSPSSSSRRSRGASRVAMRLQLPSAAQIQSTMVAAGEVRAILAADQSTLSACLDPERASAGPVSATLAFVVGGEGRVLAATMQKSTLAARDDEECVLAAVRRWRFANVAGGQNATVTLPLVFMHR